MRGALIKETLLLMIELFENIVRPDHSPQTKCFVHILLSKIK